MEWTNVKTTENECRLWPARAQVLSEGQLRSNSDWSLTNRNLGVVLPDLLFFFFFFCLRVNGNLNFKIKASDFLVLIQAYVFPQIFHESNQTRVWVISSQRLLVYGSDIKGHAGRDRENNIWNNIIKCLVFLNRPCLPNICLYKSQFQNEKKVTEPIFTHYKVTWGNNFLNESWLSVQGT